MSGHLEVIVRRTEKLSGDVHTFELVAADGGQLPPFEAGAHIELFIRSNLIRPYSLCNDPEETHRYRIGVLNDANSRGGSKIVCTQWAEGMRARISSPRNLFPLEPATGRSLLIAGGIGATPLIAMAHALGSRGAPFEFHYCARDRSKAPFLEELLAGSLAPSVQAHFSEDRRFDFTADIGAPTGDDHIYVCGPQGFMDHVIEAARGLGWPDARIHFEYFDAETDTSGGPFKVQLADGTEFEIPAGRSIADVLIEQGCEVEVSCEKGICGSCITDILEGLPDHRDHYLTDEEKAQNNCMALCCSRALSPLIKLDL
ncbi:PDR/VanB family oxidoreductase [Novosphingobium sp. RL4]|uniref:PDR/VanB family oxidoreductase n=1 Tax=Novosphingobium sp. RL4 TaxID=3109595 RepID=UPI002D78E722|nr:PDR/VanB family oxidoreductase [Novosphingobium sp. RL4]WRT94413.1 PDR/VanB family oxidoreductase [Novosphingobium sp. RL4]